MFPLADGYRLPFNLHSVYSYTLSSNKCSGKVIRAPNQIRYDIAKGVDEKKPPFRSDIQLLVLQHSREIPLSSNIFSEFVT